MCYGNLDPKHALREMDARLKSVAVRQDNTTKVAPAPVHAPGAWVRAAVRWLKWKDHAHV